MMENIKFEMYILRITFLLCLIFVGVLPESCPLGCTCYRRIKHVNCDTCGLQSVPLGIPTNVVMLSLSGNPIQYIVEDSFSRLRSLQDINVNDCEIVDIADVAFKQLSDLSHLSVNSNNLSYINGFLQYLPSLQNLSLADNAISSLNDQVFRGTWYLRRLDLSGNRFESIPSTPLQNLTVLEEIILRRNHLKSVDPYDFQTLTELRKIDIADNDIVCLSRNAFRGLENLVELYLDGNKLNVLDAPVFEGLSRLQVLSLSRNQLSSLSTDLLAEADTLTEIDLSQNRFEHVPTDSLEPLLNLKTLSLAGNKISTLVSYSFLSLSSLKYLYLDNTTLTVVQEYAFAGLVRLKGLSLTNNRLQFLSGDEFNELMQLEVLLLSDNPWRCDCSLVDFLELLKSKDYVVTGSLIYFAEDSRDVDPPLCQTPKQWEGTDLEDVAFDSMECGPQRFVGMDLVHELSTKSTVVGTTGTISEHFWGSFTKSQPRVSTQQTTELLMTSIETATSAISESQTIGFQQTSDSPMTFHTEKDSVTFTPVGTLGKSESPTKYGDITFTMPTTTHSTVRTTNDPITSPSTRQTTSTHVNHVTKKITPMRRHKAIPPKPKKAVAPPPTDDAIAEKMHQRKNVYIPTIVSSIIAGGLGILLISVMVYFVAGARCYCRKTRPVYRIKSIDSISGEDRGDKEESGTEFLVLNSDGNEDEEIYDPHNHIGRDNELNAEISAAHSDQSHLQETRLVSEATPLTMLTDSRIQFRRSSNDMENPLVSLLNYD